MTVAQVSGPAPLSRVWTKSKIIAEDLTGEDLSDVLELHADASAWWVLPRDDDYAAAELRDVAKALDLDRLAIHDLLAGDRRAKFEEVGQARLTITNAVSVDQDTAAITVHPVSIILTDRALICLVAPTPDFQPAKLLVAKESLLTEGHIEVGLQLLVTAVIDTYENAVQFLEDASDELATSLFAERPLDKSEQLRAFRLRTALSQLRRLTEPMRGVTADIVASPTATRKGKNVVRDATISRRWTIIDERQARVANSADSLRESLDSVFDTSLALADSRMNTVVKKLTGWAAILAVPTLVTSFVGMNVGFPLTGTMAGFWVYLVIMVVAGFILWVGFRRRDWV